MPELKRFNSEVDRLGWLVDLLERRFARGTKVQLSTGDEAMILLVAGSQLRAAVGYAKGIHRLLVRSLFDAAAPVERSLHELYVDFTYFLSHGNPAVNARKIQINAYLELASAFEPDELASDPNLAPINRTLDELRRDHVEEYEQVLKQRKKSEEPLVWSLSNEASPHGSWRRSGQDIQNPLLGESHRNAAYSGSSITAGRRKEVAR